MNKIPSPPDFRQSTRRLLMICAIMLLTGIPTAYAAFETFLAKTDPIMGETENHPYKNTIDVYAWSWGMSNSGTTHDGGFLTGKASIQDLSFVHRVDSTSPEFMRFALTGDFLDEMLLIVRVPGEGKRGEPAEKMRIRMERVIVTSVAASGSDGEDIQYENVTLNFARFCVTVNKTNPDGSPNGNSETCWDIPKNEPF